MKFKGIIFHQTKLPPFYNIKKAGQNLQIENSKHKIILASASPRRKEILENAGFNFEIITSECDESYDSNLSPEKIVTLLSDKKANAVLSKITDQSQYENSIIISADTIVYNDGIILGKPKNRIHAFEMITSLQGKEHSVYTGMSVVIKTINEIRFNTVFDKSSVSMISLTPEQITSYINTNEPYDKAGSYAIQGIASMFIEKISGSYHTIVGLPISKLYQILLQNNLKYVTKP